MRYNLEFRKLTLYSIIRPQSIKKSKQISGQTILSSPQDLEFNSNFAKNRDITVINNSVTRPVTPAVLTTDPGGGGTPIHYLYGYVLPNGVVILKLLI